MCQNSTKPAKCFPEKSPFCFCSLRGLAVSRSCQCCLLVDPSRMAYVNISMYIICTYFSQFGTLHFSVNGVCFLWLLVRSSLFIAALEVLYRCSKYLLLLFWPCHAAYGVLVPQPGVTLGPCIGSAQRLNQWVAREVLVPKVLKPNSLLTELYKLCRVLSPQRMLQWNNHVHTHHVHTV